MKAFPKVGLLALVAVLATAAVATSAQAAITINPAGAVVSGTASDPTLFYGVATVVCNEGTANGRTDDPAGNSIWDVALTFSGNCAVAGVGAATVTCQGFVTLIAEENVNATVNLGTVRLNAKDEPATGDPVFRCDVTTSVCTITVQGPQDTASLNWNLNESTNVLSANVDVQASRVGSAACGPQGPATANFQADYVTTPTNLTIDGTP